MPTPPASPTHSQHVARTDDFLPALRDVSAQARRWEEHCGWRNGELLQPALLECEMHRFGMILEGLLEPGGPLLGNLRCSQLIEISTHARGFDVGSRTAVTSWISAELRRVASGFSHAMSLLRGAPLRCGCRSLPRRATRQRAVARPAICWGLCKVTWAGDCPQAFDHSCLQRRVISRATDLLGSLMDVQRAFQTCLDFRDQWRIEIEPTVINALDSLNVALRLFLAEERLKSFSQGLLDTMRECAITLGLGSVVEAFTGEERRLVAAVHGSVWLAQRLRGVQNMDDKSLRALCTNVGRLSDPSDDLVTLAAGAAAELGNRRLEAATDQLPLVLHSAP